MSNGEGIDRSKAEHTSIMEVIREIVSQSWAEER